MRIRRPGFASALALAIGLICWTGIPAYGQADAPDMSGISVDGDYGYGLPPDVSVRGHEVDSLINVLHWFMLSLFVGWGIFMAYCLIRFRRREGHRAEYGSTKAKPAKYIEVGVIAFEAFLLLGFSIPIWGTLKNELPTDAENPLTVRVVAEQFSWNFHYAGADGIFGRSRPEHIDSATNPIGLDPADANGEDDIVSGELNLPIDRKVICEVSSKDVIHSFSIPVMRVKQDVIPGMRIPVWFEAKKTGTYQVACAQLCGNNHYKMLAPLVLSTPADFEKWLEQKSAPPEEFDEDDLDD